MAECRLLCRFEDGTAFPSGKARLPVLLLQQRRAVMLSDEIEACLQGCIVKYRILGTIEVECKLLCNEFAGKVWLVSEKMLAEYSLVMPGVHNIRFAH